MTVISEDQRKEEIANREAMLDAADSLTKDEKLEQVAQINIRNRLMARLTKKHVETAVPDSEGVTIVTRLMKGSERERFIKYNKRLEDSKTDLTIYNEAMNGLKQLAADINQTPHLSNDYWTSGEVSDDLVMIVLLNTFNGAANAVMEGVSSFRPK